MVQIVPVLHNGQILMTMNKEEGRASRPKNLGPVRSGRFTLLLVSILVGGYLVVSGRGIGFGVVFLLVGLWLILDNPFDRPTAQEESTAVVPPDKLVTIEPGDTLDLHTFAPRDVSSLLDEYIYLCQRDNIHSVRIIHGKGTGTLRRRVRGLLARDPRIAAFYDAPPKLGGWGVTVVELKQNHLAKVLDENEGREVD
jgi:hypothetical protein